MDPQIPTSFVEALKEAFQTKAIRDQCQSLAVNHLALTMGCTLQPPTDQTTQHRKTVRINHRSNHLRKTRAGMNTAVCDLVV